MLNSKLSSILCSAFPRWNLEGTKSYILRVKYLDLVSHYSLPSNVLSHSSYQITCYLSSLTLYIIFVSMALWHLGSPWQGQTALHLLHKHFLCWKYIYSFRNCGRFYKYTKTFGDGYFPSYQIASFTPANNSVNNVVSLPLRHF
jgi:hypothetical protein